MLQTSKCRIPQIILCIEPSGSLEQGLILYNHMLNFKVIVVQMINWHGACNVRTVLIIILRVSDSAIKKQDSTNAEKIAIDLTQILNSKIFTNSNFHPLFILHNECCIRIFQCRCKHILYYNNLSSLLHFKLCWQSNLMIVL